MSEYTPTTEDIRNYWIAQGIKRSSKRDRRAADFDRWFDAERAKAWEQGVSDVTEDIRLAYKINVQEYGPNPYPEH